MQRHAFWARLNPGYEEHYIDAHRRMPQALTAAYREAGINQLLIFRHQDLLFLYLECEDLEAAAAALEKNPDELQWQKMIAPMLEAGDFQKLDGIFQLK